MSAAAQPLLAALARAALVALTGLVTWSVLPALAGWQPYAVTSGSMAPAIEIGDVVLADPAPRAPEPGQVLVVDDPLVPGTALTHRVVSTSSAGIVLQGDANAVADTVPVAPAAVRGTARLVIPAVGLPALWWQEGRRLPLALGAAGLVVLVLAARTPRPSPAAPPSSSPPVPRHRDSPPAPPRHARSRFRLSRGFLQPPPQTPSALVPGALALVLLAMAALVPAPPTGAALTGTTATAGSWRAGDFVYDAAVRASSPGGSWPLDEPSGTVARAAAGAADGTYLGGVTLGGAGRRAGVPAARFDGADDQVVIGDVLDHTGTSPFTVECWLRRDAAGSTTTRGIVSKVDDSTAPTRGWSLRVRGSAVSGDASFLEVRRWTGGTDPQVLTGSTALALDTWHHVAATYDGAVLRLYVDGGQQASTTSAGMVSDHAQPLRIGADPGAGRFAGSLADVAVYTRALPDAEIAAHYQAR